MNDDTVLPFTNPALPGTDQRWSYLIGQVCGKVKLQIARLCYAACLMFCSSW